jgi:hypothetical protein
MLWNKEGRNNPNLEISADLKEPRRMKSGIIAAWRKNG